MPQPAAVKENELARHRFLLLMRRLMLRSEGVRGYLLLGPALFVVATLMLVPFVLLLAFSFGSQDYMTFKFGFSLANYLTVFDYQAHPIFLSLLSRSLLVSLTATLCVIVLSYPVAYYMAFRTTGNKTAWLIAMTVPFWTSYLLRVFAWKVILGFNGLINSTLILLGIVDHPLDIFLYNSTAVTVVLTYSWLAFAVLPIYVSLEKIDRTVLEAATDLGDGPLMRFVRVTLPLSLPGVLSAFLLVFIPTVADYITPSLVGGTNGAMISGTIRWLIQDSDDAPLAAAVATAMMLSTGLIAGSVVIGLRYGLRVRGRR